MESVELQVYLAAAGRPVHPELWRCVGAHLDEQIFPDIRRLAGSGNRIDREAAALACARSSYDPAKELLAGNADLRSVLDDKSITWEKLAEKAAMNAV